MLYLLAAADLAVLGGALWAGWHPGGALLLHLFLTLASVALWWRSGTARRFAPAVGMALGSAGVVCAMAAPAIGTLTGRWRFLRSPPEEEDDATRERDRGSGGAMVARLLDGRVRHPDPDSLGSLIGVLRHGTVDERRRALETAVRSFDPRLSTVVARALTDDDQTIRALAAAAAARLAQRLAEKRVALADALTMGDDGGAARLRAVLMDHSRFDVLLSETQREQVGQDASDGADAERRLVHALNQGWKARDFGAIDRLCEQAAHTPGHHREPVWAAARWWAGQPCS